jgi:hypothetical protein
MNDTPVTIEDKYREMIMSCSPADRIAMACRMFSSARSLTAAGIRQRSPDLGADEIKQRIFLRFYSHEYGETELQEILGVLNVDQKK